MNQVIQLKNEFQKLFNGSPWIDVNTVDSLSVLTAAQAAGKPLANTNSIWEIVNHLTSWRETVMKRVKGDEAVSPDNNFFEAVTDTSPLAWKEAMLRLEKSQQLWDTLFNEMNEDDLEQVWKNGNQSNYELISGLLQHDAYHLGQIVILKKFI